MSSFLPLFFSTFLPFFLLPPTFNAFNITKILGQYPDYSTFSDGLTRSGVAGTINSRQTITVLAVDNAGMSGLSGDMLKEVLSLHVVLDYYDVQKLQQLPNKSDILTTLFQASGQANGKKGFLNVTRTSNGVVFGSAVPGSSLNSNLVKSIASQPYNISVLQVSSPIMPPNLGGGGSGSNSSLNSTSSSSPASTPINSPPGAPISSPVAGSPPKSSPAAPAKSLPDAPTSSPGGSPPMSSPTAFAPSNSSDSALPPDDAGSPSDATAPSASVANSPSNATAPTADTPATASSPLGPTADAPEADAPAAGKSSGGHARPHGYLISGFGAIAWSAALTMG